MTVIEVFCRVFKPLSESLIMSRLRHGQATDCPVSYALPKNVLLNFALVIKCNKADTETPP